MSTAPPSRKTIPVPAIVAGIMAVIVVAAAAVYLSRPALPPESNAQASQEAKAYVGNLQLSDVTMQATENFMKQQVVEVQGNIANRGPRALKTVDVYCLFQGIDGRQIGRERLPIVQAKGSPLKSGGGASLPTAFRHHTGRLESGHATNGNRTYRICGVEALMTLLVAEDDPDQLMIRSMLFRQSGFHVLEAQSYQSAMKAALAERIQCAVIDLRLPTEQDGLRLIRDLKADQPAVLIYVLTGSRIPSVTASPELALADEVFGKGQAISTLLERVNQLRQDV